MRKQLTGEPVAGKLHTGFGGRGRRKSFPTPITALEHLLPRRQLSTEELADIISKRHDLRRKAKESHARRSQVALE